MHNGLCAFEMLQWEEKHFYIAEVIERCTQLVSLLNTAHLCYGGVVHNASIHPDLRPPNTNDVLPESPPEGISESPQEGISENPPKGTSESPTKGTSEKRGVRICPCVKYDGGVNNCLFHVFQWWPHTPSLIQPPPQSSKVWDALSRVLALCSRATFKEGQDDIRVVDRFGSHAHHPAVTWSRSTCTLYRAYNWFSKGLHQSVETYIGMCGGVGRSVQIIRLFCSPSTSVVPTGYSSLLMSAMLSQVTEKIETYRGFKLLHCCCCFFFYWGYSCAVLCNFPSLSSLVYSWKEIKYMYTGFGLEIIAKLIIR